MTIQLWINILVLFSLYLLISMAVSISYLPTKYFNLTIAISVTFAAFLSYFFTQQLNLSIWIAAILAVPFSMALGMFFEFCLFQKLRFKGATSLILLVTSLGLYLILQNLLSMLWGDQSREILTEEVKVGHNIFGAYITDVEIYILVVSLIMVTSAQLFLKYSQIGKNIRAVSVNPELAEDFGINPQATIYWAVGIGYFLASIMGILFALKTNVSPTIGFNLALTGIVIMIISGIGSFRALLLGSALLAISQNFIGYYFDNKWMDSVTYILLVLFLIWRPYGFSGRKLKKIEI